MKKLSQKQLKTAVLASALAFAMPLGAMAQGVGTFGPEEGNLEFTLGGNGSSAQDFDAGGFGIGGSLGYYATKNWELSLRQSVNYSNFGKTSWNGSTRGAVDYVFDLKRWRPFVGANFGGSYGEGVPDTFAAGLEGGLKYYVMPKTFVFGMIEYQWLFKNVKNVDNTFDDGQFIYSLGVGFNF